jgi:hypothetical protein
MLESPDKLPSQLHSDIHALALLRTLPRASAGVAVGYNCRLSLVSTQVSCIAVS